ncbi:MAG: hypothetical protein AUJ92_01665 [Armatimonadetes bacterium CG2_30_59_28]|nr:hypothetical protein [Armatimonadota bacterium]OIO98297.1 MAG: hypothetical protein AUJ92_01665 [Armatimonadetes bacterium CG2_30_59_28]PIU66732.1 MAG: hypothetical protein COS85_03570 [Armatimonadetes bacterium CG07_land_8_20_14_0_80_59_28]
MKRPFFLIGMILGALISASDAAPPPGRNDGTYLHEVRMVVETPHIKWLKPNAKGKPKVLFLVRRPGIYGRTIVELAQRMDLDYTAFLYAPDQRERDYWESNIAGSRTPEKEQEAIDKLSQPYDAIVLIAFDGNWLPKQAQYYLLRQVQGGTGLIAADCALPWPTKPAPEGRAAITTGVPFSALPAYSLPEKMKSYGAAKWQDMPARVVQTATFGSGRVALIRPYGFGIEPEDEVYCNYHYSLFLRALQWATASLKPDFTWKEMPEGAAFERGDLPNTDVSVKLSSTLQAPAELAVVAAIRNPFGEEESRNERKVTINSGDNDLPLAIPVLSTGAHFCDVWLKSAKGVEQYGAFGFTVASPVTIADMSFDNRFHELGDRAAELNVTFSAPLPTAGQLAVRATDTYGRQVANAVYPVAVGATETKARVPLDLVVALAQWVRVDLLPAGGNAAAGVPFDSRQALLIVRRKEPAEYPSLLWGGVEHGLDGLHQLRRQRDIGFNITLVGTAQDESTARFAALADMQLCSYATRIGPVTDGKEGTVTNPEVMKRMVTDVIERHRACSQYGVYVYSLGDECFTGGPDQALAPSDVTTFREFLKKQYGSLEELNRVWQTTFASFDEIQPVDWGKATDPKQFPQKHERLAFIEHLYARSVHEFRDAFEAMDPNARVGAEGSEPGDLEETLQGLKMWGPYSDRRIDVLLASLAPRSLVRGMWWGGYHGGTLDRPASVKHFWRQVFEGVTNTNYFFDGHLGHHETNVASDLSWADYFEQIIPDLRQIYETPGPLISAATSKDFGVALLWSQPSEHAGLFYAPFGPPRQEALAQFSALDASGVNYKFVTTRQLETQGLDPKEVKVLLLPMSTALSLQLAEALRKYVEAGGVLFADGSAGMMDGHCAMLEMGQLDGLLGVKRTGASQVKPVAVKGQGNLLGRDVTVDLTGIKADASLRADGAEVVLSSGEIPVLTQRRVGKGAAVFLNGSIAERISRGEAGLSSARDLMGALLDTAKVRPLFAVEPLGSARVYSHALGKVTLLSSVRKSDKDTPTIKLGEKAHVYDCLHQKSLGETDTITAPSDSRGFDLFAVSRDDLKAPRLTAPAFAQRGTAVKVAINLPSGEGRIVRLDVHRPDGSWVRVYRKFVTLKGNSGNLAIPFAINDPTGVWKIRATDLASGLAEEEKITIH